MRIQSLILAVLLSIATALPSCIPPSWVVEAENIAKVALPIVTGLSNVLGGSAVVPQVVNDINVVISLFDQYQNQPSATTLQKIQAGVTVVNADLAQILSAAHVENAATQNKVTAILQLVSSEFAQIASLLPAAQGSGPLPASAPSRVALASAPGAQGGASPQTVQGGGKKPGVKLPFSAKEFKAQYNRIVRSKTGDPVCDAAFAGKELN